MPARSASVRRGACHMQGFGLPAVGGVQVGVVGRDRAAGVVGGHVEVVWFECRVGEDVVEGEAPAKGAASGREAARVGRSTSTGVVH